MATITIRDVEYEIGEYCDRDLMALSNIVNFTIPRKQREQEACEVLREVIPGLPPEFTEGDKLRLHSSELVRVTTLMQAELIKSDRYLASLDPLRELLPESQRVAVDQLKDAAIAPLSVEPEPAAPVEDPTEKQRAELSEKIKQLFQHTTDAEMRDVLLGLIG